MNIAYYQDYTEETAIYPTDGTVGGTDVPVGIDYTAHGVAGEAGECQEKVKKAIREDSESYIDDLFDELGDVCWYVAESLRQIGVALEDALASSGYTTETFAGFQADVVSQAKPGETFGGTVGDTGVPSDLDHAVHELYGSAAMVTACVSDSFWQDDLDLVSKDGFYAGLEMCLVDVLERVARVADEAGMSLGEIVEANVEKLVDRDERDVLTGEGDDR